MNAGWLLIVGGAGTVCFAAWAWLIAQDRRSASIRERVRQLRGQQSGAPATEGSGGNRVFHAASSVAQRLMPDAEGDRRHFSARLQQAGLVHPEALARFFAARLCGLVVPFVLILGGAYFNWISTKYVVLKAVATGGIGWLLPSFWLDRRIAHRQTQLRRALPDFMDLMIVCLQSGQSVPAALQRVTDEISLAHPVLSGELEIVQRDTTLGAQLDVAFHRFAERTGLDSVRILATFIREARRFGSEIIDALRSHAEAMRFQREQAAEENAQKASVKILFPMLLLILPAVFVVLAGPAVIQIQKAFAK